MESVDQTFICVQSLYVVVEGTLCRNIDERKLQLLESRLMNYSDGGNLLQPNQLTKNTDILQLSEKSDSNQLMITPGINYIEVENQNGEYVTTEDNTTNLSHRSVIHISDSTSNTKSRSNYDKEINKSDGPSVGNSKKKRNQESNSNDGNIDFSKSPKQKKTDEIDNSPENNGVGGTKPRTIQSYFHPQNANINVKENQYNQQNSVEPIASSIISNKIPSNSSLDIPNGVDFNKKEKSSAKQHKANADSVNQQNGAAQSTDFKKQLDHMKTGKEQAEIKLQRVENEVRIYEEKVKSFEDKSTRLVKLIEELYRKVAFQDFRVRRDKLALDCVRLGKIATMRTGPTSITEVWEEGYAARELSKRSGMLLERKEELETRRKKTQSLKRLAKRSSSSTSLSNNGTATLNDQSMGITINDEENELDLDLLTETEVIKTHLEQLKRDESALAEERRLLENDKAVHQKELKRCQCEERSRFYRELPTLHERYLLQSMLGRGGFSEVWKAFDLQDLREVAVKVHQLNPTWSDERKSSYIKHVTREYTIHKDMRHPRVVHLYDVFEIDVNSFATVLEYCRGIDLDEKLKRCRTIPEKDARSIFMQIMSGLRYLNRPFSYGNGSSGNNSGSSSSMANGVDHGQLDELEKMKANSNRKISIIHFDLKPANILFDENGDVKITDFGLSKIIDESHEGTSMELTSQGAGTYWYLPPECFAKGSNPPRITSKVDVWSAGVILYQMLYGTRPYGEGKSQENVWAEGIIYNASQVEFPSDPKAPKVSEEAKDIIRACLTKDVKLRPDVVSVCQYQYLKNK